MKILKQYLIFPDFFKLETQTTVKHLFVLCSLDKLNVVGFWLFL